MCAAADMFALKDVSQPVLLSGKLLCCFMVSRVFLLPNEPVEEVTGVSPSGKTGRCVTRSHMSSVTELEGFTN